MFIKYKNNIYNLNNYYSIVKCSEFIHLTQENDKYTVLSFNSAKIRDIVLSFIWDKLKDHVEFFDIDDIIDDIIASNNFNL